MLRKRSKSETAQAKDRIQELLRQVSILRDGGCFLRNYAEAGKCGGYRKDGELILQFDHLHSRANNISFGDPRLGLCVCLRHHIYFKRQYPAQYETLAIKFIGKRSATLLKRVREDTRSYSMGL